MNVNGPSATSRCSGARGMAALGHEQTMSEPSATSALHPLADIGARKGRYTLCHGLDQSGLLGLLEQFIGQRARRAKLDLFDDRGRGSAVYIYPRLPR